MALEPKLVQARRLVKAKEAEMVAAEAATGKAHRRCERAFIKLGEEKRRAMEEGLVPFHDAFSRLQNVHLQIDVGDEGAPEVDEIGVAAVGRLTMSVMDLVGATAAAGAAGATAATATVTAVTAFATASTGTAIGSLSGRRRCGSIRSGTRGLSCCPGSRTYGASIRTASGGASTPISTPSWKAGARNCSRGSTHWSSLGF